MNPLRSPAADRRVADPRAVDALPPLSRRGALALAAATLASVAGCGGGGDATTTTTTTPTASAPGASSYTVGTVLGFGSVVVNGIRFDDSAATVQDDSGGLRTIASIKLGMRVEVDAGPVDAATLTARALAFRYGGRVTGPIAAINTAAGTLTVLGQTVVVDTATVFDSDLGATTLAGLSVGTVVEVHGTTDASTGVITATRLEAESSSSVYKVAGTVASIDPVARTLVVGAATFSYAGVAEAARPTGLGVGTAVRLTVDPTPGAGGVWVVKSFNGPGKGRPKDVDRAELRGAIDAFTSTASFSVEGTPVDASAAAFPDGVAGLALGTRVEVHGALVGGVLVATRVEIEDRHRGDDNRRVQLHGTVSSLDTAAKTFVVRGTTVTYSTATAWVNGTEATLANGVAVKVKAAVGSTRTQVAAERVTFGG